MRNSFSQSHWDDSQSHTHQDQVKVFMSVEFDPTEASKNLFHIFPYDAILSFPPIPAFYTGLIAM